MWFMRSAGYTSTALPRPRPLVRWANSMASRRASMRISLLGLRFLSSMSACAFSGSGQPRTIISVSGISTTRSVCVCTSIAWQLAHWPQAPSGVGVSELPPGRTEAASVGASHNQARTRPSAN